MVTAHASRLATLRHASSTRVDATLAALFDARPAVDERLEAAMRHGLWSAANVYARCWSI